MFQIIQIGIKNWIYGDFDEELPQGEEVSDAEFRMLQKAYEMQNVIGWEHFLVGWISVHWKEFFSLRTSDGLEKEGKVLAFSRTLVRSIWTYTMCVWKSHNEAVHGKKGSHVNRNHKCVRNSISEIYQHLQVYVSTEDEWLFREEVKIRTAQSLPQMVGWLERVLLCFDSDRFSDDPVVTRAKHVLLRASVCSIYS